MYPPIPLINKSAPSNLICSKILHSYNSSPFYFTITFNSPWPNAMTSLTPQVIALFIFSSLFYTSVQFQFFKQILKKGCTKLKNPTWVQFLAFYKYHCELPGATRSVQNGSELLQWDSSTLSSFHFDKALRRDWANSTDHFILQKWLAYTHGNPFGWSNRIEVAAYLIVWFVGMTVAPHSKASFKSRAQHSHAWAFWISLEDIQTGLITI